MFPTQVRVAIFVSAVPVVIRDPSSRVDFVMRSNGFYIRLQRAKIVLHPELDKFKGWGQAFKKLITWKQQSIETLLCKTHATALEIWAKCSAGGLYRCMRLVGGSFGSGSTCTHNGESPPSSRAFGVTWLKRGQTGAGSTAGSVDRGVGKVIGCTPTGELSVCGTFSLGVTTIGYIAGLKRYAAGAYPGEERPLCA